MLIIKNLLSRLARKQSRPIEETDTFVEASFDAPPNDTAYDLPDADLYATTQPKGINRLFGGNKTPKPTKAAKPKKQMGKGRPHLIIGTVQALQAVLNDPPPTNTTLFVTGDLVLLSDTDAETPEDYTRQPGRITKSLTGFSKRTIPFTLKVWLHQDVIKAKRELKRHRFSFAIDQYLQYGKSHKDKYHLVTGSLGENKTIIHTFTFDNGNLTAIEEINLPSLESQRFTSEFNERLNALRKGGLPIYIVDPLPEQNSDQFSYVGNEIYNRVIHYPITDDSSSPSFLTVHGLPIAILIAAIGIKIGAMVIPYNAYNHYTTDYQKVIAAIPKTDLIFAADQLKTMQQRRFFLSDARAQQQNIDFLRQTTFALATEGVIIKNIELKPAKQRPEDPDIAITIQTKRNTNESVLEQGKPLLEHLSAKLGIDLYLAHNGYQERNGANGSIVQYNIEGNFKEKQQ